MNYAITPIGINIKDSDRNAPDGSLKECLGWQWRDGSHMPIPHRTTCSINKAGYKSLIFHKVADENQINVIAFNISDSKLYWIGQLDDGVYTEKVTPVEITGILYTSGISFTILNGVVYFMGDGTITTERYYYSLTYSETDSSYTVKDMYEWKTLVPRLNDTRVGTKVPLKSNVAYSTCGMVAIRFALVLKSGEIVLHSPIYPFTLRSINASDSVFTEGDLLTNIHTFVDLDYTFHDTELFDDNISAINIYASTPFYVTKFEDNPLNYPDINEYITGQDLAGEFQKQAESVFYLAKTIDGPTVKKLLLYVGEFASDIEFEDSFLAEIEVFKVDLSTIAAGEIMPVDNFSYHYRYGILSSYNGRINIKSPITILGDGHFRALEYDFLISTNNQYVAYKGETEDGNIAGVSSNDYYFYNNTEDVIFSRGLLSYPDSRISDIGVGSIDDTDTYFSKSRANSKHNLSCAFDISAISIYGAAFITTPVGFVKLDIDYNPSVRYDKYAYTENNPNVQKGLYSSQNLVQFSASGEFRVFPVANAYRVGEGKIMAVGVNALDPANTDNIAGLVIGTSDGVYTANLDPTGSVFIASITRAKNIPYLSEETLNIDGNIIFVSDKGLMAITSGDVINLTSDFFPDFGNGEFPTNETVYPNYNLLTSAINPELYEIDDIVKYMKGAFFAYDGRRNNIWCCNDSYPVVLIYNTVYKTWSATPGIYREKSEYFSIINDGTNDIYTRYLLSGDAPGVFVLSGEDEDTAVYCHMMTRPIKANDPDVYKKIKRMFERCEFYEDPTFPSVSHFYMGVWGKQDQNKNKVSIPIVAIKDFDSFDSGIRQDIPIGLRKGKYKSIVIATGGVIMPNSKINGFEIDLGKVDTNKIR